MWALHTPFLRPVPFVDCTFLLVFNVSHPQDPDLLSAGDGIEGATPTDVAGKIHNVLSIFGLTNAAQTIVGNDLIRGVSGGVHASLAVDEGCTDAVGTLACDCVVFEKRSGHGDLMCILMCVCVCVYVCVFMYVCVYGSGEEARHPGRDDDGQPTRPVVG